MIQQKSVAMRAAFLAAFLAATSGVVGILAVNPAEAYPIFAQQNYANPREANGRIVCANCHLAHPKSYSSLFVLASSSIPPGGVGPPLAGIR